MTRWQIRNLQIPTKGAGAFTPMPAPIPTAATNGQNQVVGAPGTLRIISPRPTAVNDGNFGGPYNQPSSVAPNWTLPTLYVVRMNQTLRFPGKFRSDNVLPVPSVRITATPVVPQRKHRIGGQRVTRDVRVFPQWPTYGQKRRPL